MGVSSGPTTKTTSNSTANTSTTPTVPGFAQWPTEDYYKQVGDFGLKLDQDPNLFNTPTNALQQQAGMGAAGLPTGQAQIGQSNAFATAAGNATPGTYTAPTIAPTSSGSAASILDGGLDRYFNPYEQRVIDTTLADMDVNSNKTRGDFLAAGAANRGLAGSRFGIAQGALEGDLSRARSSADAGLRSSGFDRATSLANQDADRRQQTAMAAAAAENARALAQAGYDAQGGMFNIGTQQQQADRQLAAAGQLTSNAGAASGIATNNVNTQNGIGKSLWDVDQYNTVAGLTGLQGFGSLLDPALIAQFSGQDTTGTETGSGTSKQSGGLLQQLMSAGSQLGSAAILASERHVKRDIELLDREPDGLGVYHYNYVWDAPAEPKRMGVMVDEVTALRPWALGPIRGGIQTVDYSKLEAA